MKSASELLDSFLSFIFAVLNGEFFLSDRANGGGVIAIRTIWSSTLAFLASLGIYSWLGSDSTFEFDWATFACLVRAKFEWLGAIAVAIYVALYARFSAQWGYLGALYNQIMQSRAESVGTPDVSGRPIEPWGKRLRLSRQDEHYATWMAGFIADAFELHLAKKGIFVECVHSMLLIKGVEDAYLVGGDDNKTDLDVFREWYTAKGGQW